MSTISNRIGFGCAPLGELYEEIPSSDAQRMLEDAATLGIAFYDTAPWYGNTMSENRLGKHLTNLPKGSFTVSTKVGRVYDEQSNIEGFELWTGGERIPLRFDYSSKGIIQSYLASKERLQVDPDFLVIHDLDADYHGKGLDAHWQDLQESGFQALIDLKNDEKTRVKKIGAGINFDQQHMVDRFLQDFLEIDFFLVAMPYTLLNQDGLAAMNAIAAAGKFAVIGSPFASGILASASGSSEPKYNYGEAPPEILEKVVLLERACEKFNISLSAAALQFPLLHPAAEFVIPGMSSSSEVALNIAAMQEQIPPNFWKYLKDEGLIESNTPVELFTVAPSFPASNLSTEKPMGLG